MDTPHTIILIDKPQHITSFGVVAQVRRALGKQFGKKIKVGHTGTLDPFATGLMILVTGDFCKRAGEFSKLDKTYEATFFLGKTSTTGDSEGELSAGNQKIPTREEVDKTLAQFSGKISQIPPQFSAIKINGRRAYDAARSGEKVEIPAREVTIFSLECVSYEYPYLEVRTRVSSGTYIRTLAEDIGEVLGVGAYCDTLRRTEIADFSIENADTLEDFMQKFGEDFFTSVVIKSNDTVAKISAQGAWLEKLYDAQGDVLFGKKQIAYGKDKKSRGGMHVCFPYFGPDGSGKNLPQHGYARTAKWSIKQTTPSSATLCLKGAQQSIATEYNDINTDILYEVADHAMTATLTITNEGTTAQPISPAFHPYFFLEKTETNALINDTIYEIDKLGTMQTIVTPTAVLQTKRRTIRLASSELQTWAIWSDHAANYLCVEPSLGGNEFLDKSGDQLSVVMPGQTLSMTYRMQW